MDGNTGVSIANRRVVRLAKSVRMLILSVLLSVTLVFSLITLIKSFGAGLPNAIPLAIIVNLFNTALAAILCLGSWGIYLNTSSSSARLMSIVEKIKQIFAIITSALLIAAIIIMIILLSKADAGGVVIAIVVFVILIFVAYYVLLWRYYKHASGVLKSASQVLANPSENILYDNHGLKKCSMILGILSAIGSLIMIISLSSAKNGLYSIINEIDIDSDEIEGVLNYILPTTGFIGIIKLLVGPLTYFTVYSVAYEFE